MLEVLVNKKLSGALASLLAAALLANPANNPASSQEFGAGLFTGAASDYTVRVGYQNDYTRDRKIKTKSSGAKIDLAKSDRCGALLTLGLFERFDLYFGGGRSTANALQRNQTVPSSTTAGTTLSNVDLSMAVDHGSYWTLGARGEFWSMDNVSLNLYGEYNYLRGKVSSVTVGYFDSGSTDAKLHGRDWRAGLGAAYTIQVSPEISAVPNVEIRWSGAKEEFHSATVTAGNYTVPLQDANARHHFGASVGLGFFLAKTLSVATEVRFIDETAFGLTAEVRI